VTQAELLRYLVDSLESLAIEYMIVGSHASIYYGEPRFTQDVDVVIGLTSPTLRAFLERFPPAEFYVSESTAREAVAHRGQFNIIHGASGVKIDVFIGKDTEYDRLRFGRRQRLDPVIESAAAAQGIDDEAGRRIAQRVDVRAIGPREFADPDLRSFVDHRVDLDWAASAGATSYTVKRSTTPGGPYTTIAPGVTSTAYTDTTALNGTTYFYVVTALNASGESPNSNEASATPQAPTAPNAPTALAARATGKKKIALTWTQSTSPNVTQNKIYRSTVSGGPYSLTATIPATTSYNNSGLNSGTTYFYVVTAVNGAGLESPTSQQASATAR